LVFGNLKNFHDAAAAAEIAARSGVWPKSVSGQKLGQGKVGWRE
jgi:hypothetical protein